MRAAENNRISREEFDRLWVTPTQVQAVVESFTPGKGGNLTYTYEGIMHLASDSIAVLKITTQDSPAITKSLRVSVPDGETDEAKLLRTPGKKLSLQVPLLFVRYDPWGFVPLKELDAIKEIKMAVAPDGLSFETAVALEAKTQAEGVAAQGAWIEKNLPGARPASPRPVLSVTEIVSFGQELIQRQGKLYSVVALEMPDGKVRYVYFDVSGYFGK